MKNQVKTGVHIDCLSVCKILGKAHCNDYNCLKDSGVIEEKERGKGEGLPRAQRTFGSDRYVHQFECE